MSYPLGIAGGPGRTRTFGQLIKSQLLYQLSYRPREHRNDGILEEWNDGENGKGKRIHYPNIPFIHWRARQDSNLRPTGSKPGALSS
jgi:hypothetical protein